MSELYFKIPDWFLYFATVFFCLQLVISAVGAYYDYKLRKMEKDKEQPHE